MILALSGLGLPASLCSAADVAASPSARQVLWYEQPAGGWESEALPIGNGRLGAMLFGGADREIVQLNEDSLWLGDEKDTGMYQNLGEFGGASYIWVPGDAAWVAQNIWDHYAFTMDKEYLRTRAYPIIKELCEFWEDSLKEGQGCQADRKVKPRQSLPDTDNSGAQDGRYVRRVGEINRARRHRVRDKGRQGVHVRDRIMNLKSVTIMQQTVRISALQTNDINGKQVVSPRRTVE